MISVIVPVYNGGPYLKPCLDSILAQTYGDWELLLIDDGSTDGSSGICDAYGAKDGRIRVFHQDNRGLSAARNRGLDLAKGECLAFVDGDDVLDPDMLAVLLTAISGADLAVCNIRRLSEDGIPEECCPIEDEILSGRAFAQKLLLPQAWFYVTVMNRLYRRELFRGLRFLEGMIHEDEAIACDLAARCRRVVTVYRPLYFYRRTPGSITRRGLRIETSEKLTALSRRLMLCRKLGWDDLAEATAVRFCHTFFQLYFRFSREDQTERYFLRMEAALRAALPGLLSAGGISRRHKGYLLAFAIWPKGANCLRIWKKRLKKPGDF